MGFRKLLGAVATTLAVIGAGAAAASDEIMDFSSALRGINIAAQGAPESLELRLILPRIVVTRTGGVPTKFTYWFDVYRAGTTTALNDTTKLFGTPQRAVNFPALPCANSMPGSIDEETKPKFFGRWGGRRAHAVFRLQISCNEQTGERKEKYLTFVYSADVSQVAGPNFTGSGASNPTVWTKLYQFELAGATSIDFNRDGIGDGLLLTMLAPNLAGTAVSNRGVLIDFNTGTVVKEQAFPLWQVVNQ